jgi:hypothetical protein
MPRLHFVKAARKAIPGAGIEVGDSYYWWNVKWVSKTRPMPSQMVGSDFQRSVLEIQEAMEAGSWESAIDLDVARDDWKQQLEDLADEQDDKLQNMPDSLQSSPTGELLQERSEGLRDWARGLDDIPIPDREDFDEGDDGDQEYADGLLDAANEMAGISPF